MDEDELLDQESDQWHAATIARHRLGVNMRAGGVNLTLTCEGDATSQCHLWRDYEGDPASLRGHSSCSIADWFYEDTRAFVEDGYVGPERDGLVSGRVLVLTWGEDGCQWHYEGDKPAWAE